MRRKLFGKPLLGAVIVTLILTVPLVLFAQKADNTPSDPHAGHNMSSTDQTDMDVEHDMQNLGGTEANADDQHADSDNGSSSQGSGSHSSHGAAPSGGHGEGEAIINTPPYWTVIYIFGAFNILVIIVAGFMKNGNRQIKEVF